MSLDSVVYSAVFCCKANDDEIEMKQEFKGKLVEYPDNLSQRGKPSDKVCLIAPRGSQL